MSITGPNMNEKQSSWLGTLAQGSPLGAITEGFGDWGKRKAFDFAPEHFGGKRGKQFGKQFGNLFGMGDQGQELGQQAGRFGGTLYKGLPKGQQNSAYNTMNTMQPMVQQGLDAMTQFAGGMQNKTSAEKQALPTLGLAPILGALAGGAHGAYKAPKGSRPEGLGRGLFRGGAAGAGAGVGGLAGGVGGGILGVAISNAIAGKQNTIDKPYLPLLLALLGGGAGAYGGGKLGWGMASGVTGDNAKLDREEEEKEASSITSDLRRVRLAIEKRAFLGRALGGIGKGVGDLVGGAGKLGWRGLMRGLGVGKDVAPTSALTKGLTLGAGGLGLSAINEVLASTKGGPIELPHFGMGGDQPWWDPMMQHGRMDPKKTGFKSLLHMGARPLQTIAALTGMAGKPGSLSDFARTKGEGSRLSDFVQDPKNYRIDPVTGRGIVTGEVPISLDPSIMERMQDFHKEKEFMERMGLVRGRGSSSSSSSRRSRGRFD
jgi:hypothetical protein